jgi:dUTP pyrophosphatase
VAGFVFSRSGLGARQGLTVSQGVGVIDPDYRGEIIVSLLNTSGERRRIRRGERIAQLVLLPVFQAALVRAQELSDTSRGGGGFGHTGTL